MNTKSYLSLRLYLARKSAGLSVDEVGRELGRSGKTISAWEAGYNEPSPDMLIKVCHLFKVPISYFFPTELADTPLTQDELDLVAVYRTLDDESKAMARGFLDALLIAQEKK